MAKSDVNVHVFVENLAPEQGTFLTPVWVGFHNGDFDTYDRNRPVSFGVENLAEDGNSTELSREFFLSELGRLDGVIGSGPIAPGQVVTKGFQLDGKNPLDQYLNYASMILPSNDAWIANGQERENHLFNGQGVFKPLEIVIGGDRILDAGTEINDELPANTAFFGQQTPNTGDTERGVVKLHQGFSPQGSGGILDDAKFANADFTQEGYQVAKITISKDIIGNNRNNRLNGTDKAEWIDGKGGNDRIDGKDGSDIIFGGAGNDELEGGEGQDKLYGGAGNDELEGGDGNDLLVAGDDSGTSPLTTTFQIEEKQEVGKVRNTPATGTVEVTFENGELEVQGSFLKLTSAATGAHIHIGERGVNGGVVFPLELKTEGRTQKKGTISGKFELTPEQVTDLQEGNYYVNLHTRNNPSGELRGQVEFDFGNAVSEENELYGDEGNDILIGSVGVDHLIGGNGFDQLTGGAGADHFVLSPNSGTDGILDFQDGIDLIYLKDFPEEFLLDNLLITQGTSVDPGWENQGNVLISYEGELLAYVVGTTKEQFSADDFQLL